MKTSDIISQLQAVLPQITDMFSTVTSVTSITPSGTTATVVTAAAHGLTVGQATAISGSTAPVGITSITRVGTLVTVVTTTNHDITEGHNLTVTLSGADQAEFNGVFNLNTAVNRRTFTFIVTDAGPTTGTGTMLLQDPGNPFGYNGLFEVVTVPDTTSFTYTLTNTLTIPANGTIEMHKAVRVTGAATLERAEAMYTKQVANTDLWAFVVLDDGDVSKDRTSKNDGIGSGGPGADRRQQFLQNASVYVFSKSTKNLSGRVERDLMVDVRALLLKSLNGVKFDPDLTAKEGLGLMYVGDGIEIYNGAIYGHRFQFQLLSSITNADTVEPSLDVAFRDVNFTMGTNLGTEDLLADVDLDDEPLP